MAPRLASCKLLVIVSPADPYTALFYVCFWLKAPYLIHCWFINIELEAYSPTAQACIKLIGHVPFREAPHRLFVLRNTRQPFSTLLGGHSSVLNNTVLTRLWEVHSPRVCESSQESRALLASAGNMCVRQPEFLCVRQRARVQAGPRAPSSVWTLRLQIHF